MKSRSNVGARLGGNSCTGLTFWPTTLASGCRTSAHRAGPRLRPCAGKDVLQRYPRQPGRPQRDPSTGAPLLAQGSPDLSHCDVQLGSQVSMRAVSSGQQAQGCFHVLLLVGLKVNRSAPPLGAARLPPLSPLSQYGHTQPRRTISALSLARASRCSLPAAVADMPSSTARLLMGTPSR